MEPKLTKSSTQSTQKTSKTWKREVAVTQISLHWFLVVYVCYLGFTANPSFESMIELVLGMALWVYGFAAGAFGLDAYGKQLRGVSEAEYEVNK